MINDNERRSLWDDESEEEDVKPIAKKVRRSVIKDVLEGICSAQLTGILAMTRLSGIDEPEHLVGSAWIGAIRSIIMREQKMTKKKADALLLGMSAEAVTGRPMTQLSVLIVDRKRMKKGKK